MENNIRIGKMRKQRIEVISEIYTAELLNQSVNYKAIVENNPTLKPEQIIKLNEIEQRQDFIRKVFAKLVNPDRPWERNSPLVRAILINAANEFWSLDPKIVINEAVEIAKMYFGSPQDDNGVETLDNVIYKYVNAILQNFYKTLLKLEASIN